MKMFSLTAAQRKAIETGKQPEKIDVDDVSDLTEAQQKALRIVHFGGDPDGRSRKALQRRGLIRRNGPVWKLTEKGVEIFNQTNS